MSLHETSSAVRPHDWRRTVIRRSDTALTGFLALIGLDRAVGTAAIGRLLGVALGPITLLLIQRTLTEYEQGYYFTFSSVLALAMMLELGLSQVLLWATSAEFSQLRWPTGQKIEGEERAVARLASLLRASLRWYLMVSILVLFCLLPSGIIFFNFASPSSAGVQWKTAWILATVGTATACVLVPAWSFLEGSGRVAEVETIRLGQQILGTFTLWIALALGAGLVAIGANIAVSVGVGSIWVAIRYRRSVAELLAFRSEHPGMEWRREIWPMQWRIALSWVSGWLMAQALNPIVFATVGATAAGQVGMSLVLVQSLAALGGAWTSTKAAPFGLMVARADFTALDREFRKVVIQSTVLVLIGGLGLLVGLVVLESTFPSIAQRLLPPGATIPLVGVAIANHIAFSFALYLRSHRREPLTAVVVLHGLLVPISTWFLCRFVGVFAALWGYFWVTLVVFLGGSLTVFLTKRRAWHWG